MKPNARQTPARRVEAVVVGASAGGIEALLALLHGIPPPWRLPVVVVLHLPEGHQSHLAEIFAERLHMPVHEAADKMPIAPDSLYFAPPGYHLSIERDRCFSLSCEPPVHFSRPSIDVLMASAADAYGPALAGFLLTGANHDGAEGLLRIHMAGGITAVQDPEEAQIPIMPRAAIARHSPDHVLALRELRTLLLQLESAHAH
ncbi:CheB methylesterase [Variovorax beijingensis]|uniref:protein-glutamate methylesterase n=1 Tax=Variovorax beijingensis TaxID=2496117 RepID=A0A561B9V2_9BURK|nr:MULTISPECIES: chemotaxis protein CheB [Variovorax]MDR6455651.1 two-component system chemotaxis response regulator CheB [Variovorax paradoxus]TWD75629.1 CheB methylesterase [Variovorax beijingensis]